jgi:hypothetical protein
MTKKVKSVDKTQTLFTTAKSYANPVLMYLNIKICYLVWKRYTQIYDDCDKDSVDIDSDDFQLSEHELSAADKQKLLRLKAELEQTKGIDRRMSFVGLSNIKKRTFNNLPIIQPPTRSKSRTETKIGNILRKMVGPNDSQDQGKAGNSGLNIPKKSEIHGRTKLNSVLPIINDDEIQEQLDNSIDDSKQNLADFSRLD